MTSSQGGLTDLPLFRHDIEGLLAMQKCLNTEKKNINKYNIFELFCILFYIFHTQDNVCRLIKSDVSKILVIQ